MSRAARSLLVPLTPLYRLAIGLRAWRLAQGWERINRLDWPVVSVGNLSAGGAGKTPFTIALARALTQHGVAVDVLSRGYGRTSQIPARVDPQGSPEDFGDEPLLIARATGAPVYVARQRYEAGLLAEGAVEKTHCDYGSVTGHDFSRAEKSTEPEEGFSLCASESETPKQKKLHLLDDGFQHRQLHRDVDFLLVSRRDLDDQLLPAGNRREPLEALQRATVLVVPADEPEMEERLKKRGWQGPVWRIRRRMEVPSINGPIVAFCGIARPEQFFLGLETAGLKLAARRAFRDHRPYRGADIAALSALAAQHHAALFTTEKDAVRLGPLAETLPVLRTVPLVTEIEDEDEKMAWLMARLEPFS
jgi:tetraacyldisaccharide 4'-kinase